MAGRQFVRLVIGVGVAAAFLFGGEVACIGTSGDTESGSTPAPSSEKRQFPLAELATATVAINGHVFRVWLAVEPDQHEEGLMHVPATEIADDQGMLFVFSDERVRGFWMKNTITALDIAYMRMDGTIVKTWTMPPLTWRTFPSIEPTMFVLEVKAGTFARLGIAEGDVADIPLDVFKARP
ncbi:MAG: DUF192 domain-containing protein [Planctomycetes bacterium]|nr:DUF192 domain-containing protein [Planctomycetota bacterium]